MLLLILEQNDQLPSTGHFLGCSLPSHREIEPPLVGIAWREHSRTQRLLACAGDDSVRGFLLGIRKGWCSEVSRLGTRLHIVRQRRRLHRSNTLLPRPDKHGAVGA